MKKINNFVLMILIFFFTLSAGFSCQMYSDDVDTDGDGLSDKAEIEGWIVTYEDGFKQLTSYPVISDPNTKDTDGDGLSDFVEFFIKCDPVNVDTDGDGLLDGDEPNYGSNILDADSDDDARIEGQTTPNPELLDYNEVYVYKTSPVLDDTDGDARGDYEEITGGGFNPLIAETPKVRAILSNNPNITIIKVDSQGTIVASENMTSLQVKEDDIYNRSDTSSNKNVHEESKEVTTETEIKILPPTCKTKTTEVTTTTDQFTEETSTSITEGSARDAQQSYYSNREKIDQTENQYTGGQITLAFRLENLSDIGVEVKQLFISVLKSKPRGGFLPITTVSPITPDNPVAIDAGSVTGSFTVTGELDLMTVRELLLDPGSLVFEVAKLSLGRVGPTGDILYYSSTDVIERTTRLAVDYGDGSPVETYSIRTTLKRDAWGQQVGTTLREALDILMEDPRIDFSYETIETPVYDVETGIKIGTTRDLSQINDKPSISVKDGFWALLSSSQSSAEPLTPVDDIVLLHGDYTSLVYIKDSDEDGLYDRQEYLMGTDREHPDTDGDGRDDFEEVNAGWDVPVIGQSVVHVYSDARVADVDEDGWSDPIEMDNGTNPYEADTDGDGVTDPDDVSPLNPGNN
jgi:hypothetical protein